MLWSTRSKLPSSQGSAAARALELIGSDSELRRRQVEGGLERLRAHTLEAECAKVVQFMEG